MKEIEVLVAHVRSRSGKDWVALITLAALTLAGIAVRSGESLIALIALVAIACPASATLVLITLANRKS